MYDVAIIGAGPGGYSAAIRAGQLGLKVVCIEGSPHLGGTCLNVGCMPTKALLHASELYEAAHTDFAGLGIDVAPVLNLTTMMAQKNDSVAKLVKGIEFLFRKNNVEWIRGWARFDGPNKLIVRHVDGSEMPLAARHIVIASGSTPAGLNGVSIDQHRILTSTEALTLEKVPESLVIIGAGVIGVEIGSIWRRLGAKVTILEYQDHILAGTDKEVGRVFAKLLQRQGVEIRLGVAVREACHSGDGVEVALTPAAGGPDEKIFAAKVLVCVGRKPFHEGLNLKSIGILPDRRGAIANQGQSTGVPGVWVIGDATTGPMLAHKAEDEGIACIETIAGLPGMADHALIPNVIYTRPEIATVGRTEEQLKADGVAYRVGRFQFLANSRAKINHETDGFVKLLADAGTDRILGVHMLGPHVSEMIGEVCVAMAMGATAEDLARTSHPHPTESEALRQAAMDSAGWAMQA